MEKLLDFGDYCLIEQHRFGVKNEIYTHKVIGRLKSNAYVDVPVVGYRKETLHEEVIDVLACIVCGVDETKVLKYREIDCKGAKQ